MHAEQSAREDDDSEYAIIKAKIKNAQPDFLMGRPQWLASADDIEILGIEFIKS